MQEVLRMNEYNENQLSAYESLKLNMLLSYAVDVFDMMSDSECGDYEAAGDDREGRHITVKVTIDRGEQNEIHK